MKKKLLALLLILAMVCSTVTSVAALEDTNPPIWEQWGYASLEEFYELSGADEAYYQQLVDEQKAFEAYKAAHPDLVSAFDADAYFEKSMGGWMTKEEYLADGAMTEEEFVEEQLYCYFQEKMWLEECQARWVACLAAEPEMTAQFLEDAAYFQGYYGYPTLEEYYQDMGMAYNMSEPELYLSAYELWCDEYYADQTLQAEQDQFIVDRGGNPGQLNVMLDGQYISFPADGQPYEKDWVSYAPADALYQALELDAPGTSAYVPIRAVAEDAGYTVFYDEIYNSVVILDLDEIGAQLESQFTLFNKLLSASSQSLTAGWEQTSTMDGTITVFDTINGDKNYTFDLDCQAIGSPDGMQATVDYNFSQLVAMATQQIDLSQILGADQSSLIMLALLMEGQAELRVNYAQGTLAFHIPQLSLLNPDAQEWTVLDFFPMSMANTYGSLAFAQCFSDYSNDPVCYYDVLMDTSTTAPIIGDEAFEKQGTKQVLTLDSQEIWPLMFTEDAWSYYQNDPLPDFTITIEVAANGNVSGDFHLESDLAIFTDPFLALDGEFTANGEKSTVDCTFHLRNIAKIQMKIDSTYAPSTKTPITLPDD